MDAKPLRFSAVLVEAKMDRYGTWRVVLEVPQSEKEQLLELSAHTEKSLDVLVVPPTQEGVFGKVVGD